jgi:hypothetical protein
MSCVEIRTPKAEGRKKPEVRTAKQAIRAGEPVIIGRSDSEFGLLSGFGFRPSGFSLVQTFIYQS